MSQNTAIFRYHAPLKKALPPVSVGQKNKSSTMLSSKVHSMLSSKVHSSKVHSTPWTSQWTARPDGYECWDNRMTAQHLPRDRVRPSSCMKNWHKRRRRCHAEALINKRKWRHILFICFICLFPDTKSIAQAHTLCTTQSDTNRQNRTLYNGTWGGEITGLQTLS